MDETITGFMDALHAVEDPIILKRTPMRHSSVSLKKNTESVLKIWSKAHYPAKTAERESFHRWRK